MLPILGLVRAKISVPGVPTSVTLDGGLASCVDRPRGFATFPMALALYLVILLLFASFCTCHVWLCLKIASRIPGRALLAFFLPPLAPYYGVHLGIRLALLGWVTSGTLYLVFLLFSLLLPESR